MICHLFLLILWITSTTVETVKGEEGPYWLVVDLDNTLFESTTAYGHEHWEYDLLKKEYEAGATDEEANAKVFPLWFQSQQINRVKAVEDNLNNWIRDLHRQNQTVLGLTAREEVLIPATKRHLRQIDLDLSQTAPQGLPPKQFDRPIFYDEGILFVNSHPKGEAFKAFLLENNLHPPKVIFIDDKLRNVESMEKALSSLSIPFVCVHYTALKEKESVYIPALAEFQAEKLGTILSNDEALLLMHHQPDTHL